MLADAFVKLTEHEQLSRETVRRRLAENDLKPWRKDMWCIPKVDAEYVARMEDVLDLDAEAPDPQRPVVYFNESPTQLIGEVRQPIPAAPGRLERYVQTVIQIAAESEKKFFKTNMVGGAALRLDSTRTVRRSADGLI